nr:radical S-adenosyl methionine domain-containing protein 2-like [Onthophagus taurus]
MLSVKSENFRAKLAQVTTVIAGMKKINFSGGEPFLAKKGIHVGEMVKYCKKALNLDSVTVVTNGSMVTESWFKKYGTYLDIIAVSCDSFHEDTNKEIGRAFSSVKLREERNHIHQLRKIRDWCLEYNVLFKINTVVNTFNHFEDMREEIQELNPIRWKVFQCLLLDGENVGEKALRNGEKFYISDDLFDQFLKRHNNIKCLVPESNNSMQNSYLILDEYMRFLDCREGAKIPSKSILDIGVKNALKFSGFDEAMFKKRGGVYKWSKEADRLAW